MTTASAYRLLGASPEDSDSTLKRKYRRCIRENHPDADPEHEEDARRRAQWINEAYALLSKERKKAGGSSASRKTSGPRTNSASAAQGCPDSAPRPFAAPRNPAAFCARTVYPRWDDYMDFAGAPARETVTGRFCWDPSLETFAMFAMSVHRQCLELLGQDYLERSPIYGQTAEQNDTIRLRLFHLLMQEFIRPWACLRKLADELPDVDADPALPDCYHLPAELAVRGSQLIHRALDKVSEGDELLPAVQGERIHIRAAGGIDLGHITFADDPLYYVALPLLADGGASCRVTVRRKIIRRDVLPYRADLRLDLCFYHPDMRAANRPARRNLEIASLLRQTTQAETE